MGKKSAKSIVREEGDMSHGYGHGELRKLEGHASNKKHHSGL